MQARNALNHNQAMDADQVLKAMEHQRDVLQALQIDASQLETRGSHISMPEILRQTHQEWVKGTSLQDMRTMGIGPDELVGIGVSWSDWLNKQHYGVKELAYQIDSRAKINTHPNILGTQHAVFLQGSFC